MRREGDRGAAGRRGIMLVEVLAATILLSAVVGLTTAVFWQAWHIHRACLARLGHADEVAEFAREFTLQVRRASACAATTGSGAEAEPGTPGVALELKSPEGPRWYLVRAGLMVERRQVEAGFGTRTCVRGLERAEFFVRPRAEGTCEVAAVLVFDGAEGGRTAEARVLLSATTRRQE